VEDKAYAVSADVRTRWGVISDGIREMIREYRWARKDEANAFWECNVEELRRDGADVHWKSGVPALYCLRWEQVRELEFQTLDAMGSSRLRGWFCVDPGVRADRVASSK